MRQAQPGLPAFDYECPDTYEEVYRALTQNANGSKALGGGTDLFVQMRDGAREVHHIVDLKSLPGIHGIEDVDGGVRFGAATPLNIIGKDERVNTKLPMLSEAIETIASYQLRNRATLGGNLCNASPAADTAPSMLVLEATMHVSGPDGERELPILEWFQGPGAQALKQGEILKAVTVHFPPEGSRGTYLKLGRNASGDLAIVGVAGLLLPDKSQASGYEIRLALASVAPTPIRVPAAEKLLSEKGLTAETMSAAAELAMDAAKPIDDTRASAAYRKAMVRTYTLKVLERLAGVEKEVS